MIGPYRPQADLIAPPTVTTVAPVPDVPAGTVGSARSEDTLVHLGNHPEVGICISCVHFLRRRARDRQATVMRQTLRGAAESVRGQVMARGWHQRPVIGPALQWLNRHLPW
jgi:hypothetical protein